MKTFAVCNNSVVNNSNWGESFDYFNINGYKIPVALIKDDTYRQKLSGLNPNEILVKTRAFSCNYRDKALFLNFSERCRDFGSNAYSPFGSDFVGEIVAYGKNVKGFKEGDRVINDNTYPEKEYSMPGVPTNYASQKYHILNYDQVIKIPDNMSDEDAAGFGIGAQTGYSMIRKLNLKPDDKILLMSASSNTSLFILMYLKNKYKNIYAASTNTAFHSKLCKMGVRKCFHPAELPEVSKNAGPFDVVIDPFMDMNFVNVVPFINHFGKYITCGFYSQHLSFSKLSQNIPGEAYLHSLVAVTLNNISFIGNCVGLREDICNALQDYEKGTYNVIVDSVYTDSSLVEFLDRSFLSKDRFGKVIYKYDD